MAIIPDYIKELKFSDILNIFLLGNLGYFFTKVLLLIVWQFNCLSFLIGFLFSNYLQDTDTVKFIYEFINYGYSWILEKINDNVSIIKKSYSDITSKVERTHKSIVSFIELVINKVTCDPYTTIKVASSETNNDVSETVALITLETVEYTTEEPTEDFTEKLSEEHIESNEEPTDEPTEESTDEPTDGPTEELSEESNDEPTYEPTEELSEESNDEPTEDKSHITTENTQYIEEIQPGL
jgi:hypothetical protein